MPYKNKEDRKKNYNKNKNEINRKRREYLKNNPDARKRKAEAWQKWRKSNLENAKRISRESKKKYEDRLKKIVFAHYGKKCACCGEDNIKFLSIDHINGGGTKHRKKIKGEKIYVWLYKEGLPKGFQTLCFNCNWGKHINGGICPHKEK